MKVVVNKAESRGHADYGWIITHYSFSFAIYYKADRVTFGTLRMLNDHVIRNTKSKSISIVNNEYFCVGKSETSVMLFIN